MCKKIIVFALVIVMRQRFCDYQYKYIFDSFFKYLHKSGLQFRLPFGARNTYTIPSGISSRQTIFDLSCSFHVVAVFCQVKANHVQ